MKIIRNLDSISPPPYLYIFGNYNGQNGLGAILTILILSLILTYSIVNINYWYYSKNPTISYSKSSYLNSKYNLNETLIYFKLRINEKINISDLIVPYVYIVTPTKYINIEIELKEINEYYLTYNFKKGQSIIISNENNNEEIILFHFQKKSNLTYNNINFEIRINQSITNHSNFKNPIIKNEISKIYNYKYNTKNQYSIFLKKINYITKYGFLFEKEIKNEGIILNREQKLKIESDYENIIGEFIIKFDEFVVDEYIRNYIKLLDIFSSIGGLFSFLKNSFNLFIGLYSNSYYNYSIFSYIINGNHNNIFNSKINKEEFKGIIEQNKINKSEFQKKNIINSNFKNIHMCNAIFPCKYDLKKKLKFTDKFIKLILSYEKIALSYIQLNKMIFYLKPNEKNNIINPSEDLEYIYQSENIENEKFMENCFEISLINNF